MMHAVMLLTVRVWEQLPLDNHNIIIMLCIFVYYSPMRTAVAPLNAHVLKTRDDHSDFGADIKLHGNGGPLAIPNPYSSSRLHCR